MDRVGVEWPLFFVEFKVSFRRWSAEADCALEEEYSTVLALALALALTLWLPLAPAAGDPKRTGVSGAVEAFMMPPPTGLIVGERRDAGVEEEDVEGGGRVI